MESIDHRIGGEPVGGSSYLPVYDPATGLPRAQVAAGGAAEVAAAVDAAQQAFEKWQDTSVTKRARVMFAFRDLVERYEDDLAKAIVGEHGKVLDDARGEVVRGREVIEFACGIPTLLKGGYSDQVSTGVDSHSFRQPLGVCAGIAPFNFPVMVPMWMHPIAVACGNTFVLKPSERVPSASNLVASLYADAGLPDGAFNVVHGGKDAVDAILDHPGISAVSFVGSTPIARYVHQRASVNGKRVQALGGAKNHAVVLPDANLDDAARQITSAAYGSAGQRCMAISVAVAVGDSAEPLVEKLAELARGIKVGSGLDPASEMGPVVTAEARDRITGYVSRGATAARLVVDGRSQVEPADGGFFVGPTLIDNVDVGMDVYTDEIFGPVLAVVRVATLNDAIALINENAYGNGVALFTRDGGAARQFQRAVKVGMIGINVPVPVPMAFYSFGGWKASLFGDTHIHGQEGVAFYTRAKVVTSRWPEAAATNSASLHFPTAS